MCIPCQYPLRLSVGFRWAPDDSQSLTPSLQAVPPSGEVIGHLSTGAWESSTTKSQPVCSAAQQIGKLASITRAIDLGSVSDLQKLSFTDFHPLWRFSGGRRPPKDTGKGRPPAGTGRKYQPKRRKGKEVAHRERSPIPQEVIHSCASCI